MAVGIISSSVPFGTSSDSITGLLALLKENAPDLRKYALHQLYKCVDSSWAEIATAISQIWEFADDDSFDGKEIAAALASKVFFHLEAYEDALKLALSAGKYFDLNQKNEYVETLIAKAIDEYIALRNGNAEDSPFGFVIEDNEGPVTSSTGDMDESNGPLAKSLTSISAVEIDARLEAIVERMFERCFADEAYFQAIGIAIEARRIDKVGESVARCKSEEQKAILLKYILNTAIDIIGSRSFRLEVIQTIINLFESLKTPNYIAMCQALLLLDNTKKVSTILEKLIRGSELEALIAYQIGFNIIETDNQSVLTRVCTDLFSEYKKANLSSNPSPETPVNEGTDTSEQEGNNNTDVVSNTEVVPEVDLSVVEREIPEGASPEYWARKDTLKRILNDGFIIELTLDFLYRLNNTDFLILQNLIPDQRNSILHNAAVIAHSFMNACTTRDSFLRDNMEWIRKAKHWAQFTATASIGVVHRGDLKGSMSLLQPYLPTGGIPDQPFSQSGALYALGLIHAGKNNNTIGLAPVPGSDNNADAGTENTVSYLLNALQNASQNANPNEIMMHGACLGLGLATIGTAQEESVAALEDVFNKDEAVSGEAATLALGLTCLGTASENPLTDRIIKSFLTHSMETKHENKHEKIVRSLALAIALMNIGQEENATELINVMSRDRDALIRYGAMYVIGLAYVGTSNNNAIRQLLHVAVSDVSDDVRRVAVMNLGFILFKNHEQVPRLVSLLAASFNPHVRYGACLAVGIACAGTGSSEALNLLEPMMDDNVDYVRQGAFMSLALVLMQQAEQRIPKVKAFREKIASAVTEKSQSTMSKMGAILAAGIIDSGGRNVTISMASDGGFVKYSAVAGFALWTNYWYWFPCQHFLSLAMTPSYSIGLNKNLLMPKQFALKCNCKQSLFSYPKKLKAKKEEKKERVKAAVLSTTAKNKARLARKAKENGDEDNMDISTSESKKEEEKMMEEEKEKKEKDENTEGEKKVPEPSSFILANPSRLTPSQISFISYDMGNRYHPVDIDHKGGIVVLQDTTPNETEEIIEFNDDFNNGEDGDYEIPEPFEWTDEHAN